MSRRRDILDCASAFVAQLQSEFATVARCNHVAAAIIVELGRFGLTRTKEHEGAEVEVFPNLWPVFGSGFKPAIVLSTIHRFGNFTKRFT